MFLKSIGRQDNYLKTRSVGRGRSLCTQLCTQLQTGLLAAQLRTIPHARRDPTLDLGRQVRDHDGGRIRAPHWSWCGQRDEAGPCQAATVATAMKCK